MTKSLDLVNPPELDQGFVEGRFVRAVADQPTDDDRTLDYRPVKGSVVFSPLQRDHRTHGEVATTVLVDRSFALPLNDNGFVVDTGSSDDAELQPGAWLPVGQYRVSLQPRVGNSPFRSYVIEVTAEHTKDNPLILTEAMPESFPPETVVVTSTEERRRAEQAAQRAEDAAERAENIGVPSWAEIEDKPEQFPPAEHRHQWEEIDGAPDPIQGQRGTRWYAYGPGVPDIGEVTGMIEGDIYIYPSSADMFTFDGTEWNYVGVLGVESSP